MLYEVCTTDENNLSVYICKDPKEAATAIATAGQKMGIPFEIFMLSAPLFGTHLANPDAAPIEIMGIRGRHLSQEEYEKWQKV